jgi:hypothetical protein
MLRSCPDAASNKLSAMTGKRWRHGRMCRHITHSRERTDAETPVEPRRHL